MFTQLQTLLKKEVATCVACIDNAINQPKIIKQLSNRHELQQNLRLNITRLQLTESRLIIPLCEANGDFRMLKTEFVITFLILKAFW